MTGRREGPLQQERQPDAHSTETLAVALAAGGPGVHQRRAPREESTGLRRALLPAGTLVAPPLHRAKHRSDCRDTSARACRTRLAALQRQQERCSPGSSLPSGCRCLRAALDNSFPERLVCAAGSASSRAPGLSDSKERVTSSVRPACDSCCAPGRRSTTCLRALRQPPRSCRRSAAQRAAALKVYRVGLQQLCTAAGARRRRPADSRS